MLEVRLFGEGRIFNDGSEIKIASRRWTLPLLASVLLQRGKPILRKRLAFALWPDETEETAFVNLRRNLHRLREMLPPLDRESWIRIDDQSVAWNLSTACRIDFLDYQTLRADPERLEEAVALYTGDLLEDFFDHGIAAERERLRGLYQADLNTLIVAKRSRRAFADAAQFAQRLLQTDPWREDTLRASMSVRYEGGDAAGALAEYDRFARLLRDEMGEAPMAETAALRDVIARGEPIFAVSEMPANEGKRPEANVPFVGREEELRRLRAHWTRAASGNGGLHFVCGEAGIGKSRLVAELALLVEAEGGRVIVGTTSRPERTAYQCLSSALRGRLPLVAAVSIAPPLLAALAELVPELRSFRNDIPPVARLEPEREQLRLFDALAETLVALSRPRPLMVILEDLHRAETTTIGAIRVLVARLARSHVLIVATYRPEEVSRSHPLHALARDSEGANGSTEVRPLAEADVRAIAEAVAPEEAAHLGFIETLMRQSDGNALFVTELLRETQRTGREHGTVPSSLKRMIAARLASLAPATRNVAEVAAVAGEAFSLSMVQEVARLTQGVVLDAFDELLDQHIVRESTGRSHYEYAFTHHLVHGTVYDESPNAARMLRHRRVARLLGETAGESDERAAQIALHYERGGERSKAGAHYARAARRAAALYANAEARDLVGRALELGEWTGRERLDLVLLAAEMMSRAGNLGAESATLDEAEQLAEKLDAPARCAVLERRITVAASHLRDVEWSAGVERLAECAALAGEQRWLGVAQEKRAERQAQRDGNFSGAVESYLDALEHFRRSGDEVACARVGALAAQHSLMLPNRAKEADGLVRDALRSSETANAVETRMAVLCVAASIAYERGDYEHMAELSASAVELSRETGDPVTESRARGLLGRSLQKLWRIPESIEQLREALRLSQELGHRLRSEGGAVALGSVLMEAGDHEAGIELCRRATSLSMPFLAVALMLIAAANYHKGNVDGLAAALDEAAKIVSHLPESRFTSNLFILEGQLLRCRRQFDASVAKIEKALELEQHLQRWRYTADAFEELALTHLASGRCAEASRALTRSAELTRGHVPSQTHQYHWVRACVHQATGERDLAEAAVQRAYEVYATNRASLGDAKLQAFYAAVPAHRAICVAHELDEWPPPETPCVLALPGLERYRNARALD